MSAASELLEWVLGNDGRHEAPLDARPEPVLDEARAKVRAAALIATVVTAASTLGVSTTDAGLLGVLLTVLAGAVIAVSQAVLTMRAAYAARSRVTPLQDPRTPAGVPLVPGYVELPGEVPPLDPPTA